MPSDFEKGSPDQCTVCGAHFYVAPYHVSDGVCSKCRAEEASTIIRNDAVNHPSHYTFLRVNGSPLECIDVIEALELPYHLGNVLKYLWRWEKKVGTLDPLENLKKARWYLDRFIEYTEDANHAANARATVGGPASGKERPLRSESEQPVAGESGSDAESYSALAR